MDRHDEYDAGAPARPGSDGAAAGRSDQRQCYPPPTRITAGARAKPIYPPHPLFELDEEGQLEHRDIVLLNFERQDAEGRLIPHPELIPARDVRSWADVARWWGGGHYRVTARDAAGHMTGQFPVCELYFIGGPEKPFTARPSGCELCQSHGRPVNPLLDDLHMRCDYCGCMGKPRALAGYCYCWAKNWENLSPNPEPEGEPRVLQAPELSSPGASATPPSPDVRVPEARLDAHLLPLAHPAAPRMVSGATTARKIVDDYEGARMNEVLGGIMRGAVVLIVGAGGAGKSTATAELMAHAALYWSCPVYWLDADQRDTGLVRTCFETAGHEDFFVQPGNVLMLPERELRYTWAEALETTPREDHLLVVDSLDAWVSSSRPNDQVDLLLGLRRHPALVKVVIAGTNKAGRVSGVEALARAGDATVYAVRSPSGEYQLRYDKRRWQPCDAARARGAGVLQPPAAAASFSAELASSMPARPASPLPRTSTSTSAKPAEVRGPPHLRRDAEIRVHARDTLLRAGPWPRAMRTKDILQTLAELSGGSKSAVDAELPTEAIEALGELASEAPNADASHLGRALRWVADQPPLHGMQLVVGKDRDKFSWWQVRSL